MHSFSVLALFLAAMASAAPLSSTLSARDCDFYGCASALGPTIVACVAAAIQDDVDPITDAACFASASAILANQPPACVGCY